MLFFARFFPKFSCVLVLFFSGDIGAQRAQVTGDGQGAVATVNAIASDAAIAMFAQGGNAIDAALAAAFMLGVVDSHNSGIGGGLFAMVRFADGRIEAIDGREMAPALAWPTMFMRDGKRVPDLSRTGALAIGIPGSVAALYELHQQGGKLPFADTITPSVRVAREGFKVDRLFAQRLQRSVDKLVRFPASAAILLKDGKPLQSGDKLVQKDLAKTYEKIAKQGPDYFYRGEFAKAVDAWMKAHQGLLRYEDFLQYRTVRREPVITTFAGHAIYGFPPPSSGGAHVAQILNILSTFPLRDLADEQRYHLIIESMKLAFADRAYWMGDPDFVDVPKGIVSAEYGKELARKINPQKTTQVAGYGAPPGAASDLFDKHTTHIATADKAGNWVAITTTLNTSFGSKVTIPGTGVLMNNQMDDFAAQTGAANAFGLVGAKANSVAPAKRPLSSMSPTLVLKDKEPIMTLGAAGGPTIISQVAQILVNTLALEYPVEKALAAVRVHHQWQPDRVYIDAYASKALKQALTEKGHALHDWPPFGAAQAITLQQGRFVVQAEPRLDQR